MKKEPVGNTQNRSLRLNPTDLHQRVYFYSSKRWLDRGRKDVQLFLEPCQCLTVNLFQVVVSLICSGSGGLCCIQRFLV